MDQKAGRLPLVDSVKVRQVTQNLSLVTRLLFQNTTYSHLVTVTCLWMGLADRNPFSDGYTDMTTLTAQSMYTLTWLESRWSFIAGLTYLQVNMAAAGNSSYGFSAGLSKSLLDNKLTIGWNNALMRPKVSGDEGWTINSNLNAGYRVTRHHNLRLNVYYTGNFFPSGSVNPSFNEFKGDLMYVYSF
jgi:hypothetical protein